MDISLNSETRAMRANVKASVETALFSYITHGTFDVIIIYNSIVLWKGKNY